ncbi:hypothetical protein O6H91_05G035300 [Diphasiastrum complanatum]|uniref:Uncharacterized protein n=2 Tax=Diphasiastrum complanatum TaxID=34168 RepID=A0ACC2DMA4_DIPCM|nr:hypothetical protein O6H91_05G034600 [Diphasiastrum complanatum]KAJ7555393.1 hypothetical protein O6H91_05G035300 [Diphasiastrum complanatum]
MFLLLQWVAGMGAVAWLLAHLARLLRDSVWTPLRIHKAMKAQGVKGPPFKLFYGNQPDIVRMLADVSSSPLNLSHDILPWILPYYTNWRKIYGETLLYWFGSAAILTIADPEIMKEVLCNKFGHFPKVEGPAAVRDLFGDGLVLATGEKWAKERRILNHGFQLTKVKAMVEMMAQLTSKMLDKWDILMGDKAKESLAIEIEAQEYYRNLTADIIAHTAFGIDYEAGKAVFELQYQQRKILRQARVVVQWPGRSLLPTPTNWRRWKIKNQVEGGLRKMIETRLHYESKRHGSQENDLLGLMISAYKGELQGNQRHLRMSIPDIVDECKTFFFAGHDTTATLLTWTTMLLAMYPDWQDRVRAEVVQVCGSKPPDSEILGQLKLVDMVLYETLRLYPVVPQIMRGAKKDISLGKLFIPKGTQLCLLVLAMLHSKQVWGEDANEFNPERFLKGMANASEHRSAFLPFSLGPRNCIGQVLAIMEAKVVISMLLQRFRFTLSPGYTHSPNQVGFVMPKEGVQILVTRADSHLLLPNNI